SRARNPARDQAQSASLFSTGEMKVLHNREQITIPPDGKSPGEQPKWRRDFPIDWPEDHYVARRDFTKFMVLTSFAFVAGQAWIAAQNFFRQRRGALPMRQIAQLNQLAIGQSLAFNYPAE